MTTVNVSYREAVVLGPYEIEWNGAVYNCDNSQCNLSECCNSVGSDSSQCVKCSCVQSNDNQARKPSFENGVRSSLESIDATKKKPGCGGSSPSLGDTSSTQTLRKDLGSFTSDTVRGKVRPGGCYYSGTDNGCTGSCTDVCGGVCSNAPIFTGNYTNATLTCSAIQTMMDATNLSGQPTYQFTSGSVASYNYLCGPGDGQNIITCCTGANGSSADLCGDYYGPSSGDTNCDTTMMQYCATGGQGYGSPACACLDSIFPIPECEDTRCTNTTAYKLNSMKHSCTGNFLTCIQYDSLVSSGQASYINSSSINQNCTLNNNPSSSSAVASSAATSSTFFSKYKVYIIVGAVVAVALVITAFLVLGKKKPVKRTITSLPHLVYASGYAPQLQPRPPMSYVPPPLPSMTIRPSTGRLTVPVPRSTIPPPPAMAIRPSTGGLTVPVPRSTIPPLPVSGMRPPVGRLTVPAPRPTLPRPPPPLSLPLPTF